MQKAIFLDRDGVLNKEIGAYVTHHDFFDVPEFVPVQLKRLQDAHYILIVITNQGGIAKGLYTNGELNSIHQKLTAVLAKSGVTLTAIYYCPHHPDYGKCLCRKPGSLMIEKAISKYDIDAEQSFMIGDTVRDIEAAEAAGVKGILIEPNIDWKFVVDEILK